jgi:hypothetical protein
VEGSYPYDGSPVWLTEDKLMAHAAIWKTTRTYDAPNAKWVDNKFWAKHNSGGQRLHIDPVAYKKMEI